MNGNYQSEKTGSGSKIDRRSWLHTLGLGALGAGLGVGFAGTHASDGVAAASQGEGTNGNGVTVANSGSNVLEDVTRLDFGGRISAIEDSGGVRIDVDQDDPTTPGIPSNPTNPNVVNVQADLGVEPEEDDVWGAIFDHYSSFTPTERNHTYVIPPGTWHVETDDIRLEAHEYFEVAGHPFATLRVTDQDVDRLMTVGTIDDSLPHAQRTVMRNLRVDIRGDVDAGIGRWHTYQYGRIENVIVRGQRDRRNPTFGGDRHTLKVDGIRPEARNVIEQVSLNNGDTYYDTSTNVGHAIAFSSEPSHRGTNVWQQCQVTGYIDNGIYVSSNTGRNIVVGCRARNCAGAGIRIGANDMVIDSEIVMDSHPGHPWCGLWLENGGGQVVERLHVRNGIRKNTEIIRCTQSGPARLSNVHISDTGTDGRAIRVEDDDATQTTFEGCTITDRSSPTTSDYAVYVRSSNVTFRDCAFDHASESGQDRNGIFVDGRGSDVDRVVLDNCDVDADVASLRFSDGGSDHTVSNSFLRALVTSDADAPLSNVLWTGNRHDGETNFQGGRSNWRGGFNWNVEV